MVTTSSTASVLFAAKACGYATTNVLIKDLSAGIWRVNLSCPNGYKTSALELVGLADLKIVLAGISSNKTTAFMVSPSTSMVCRPELRVELFFTLKL